MTVGEKMVPPARYDGGSIDPFPVGMRVLAVDDDVTCLKMLEALLRRCRYHVTITNQAITALKMLRENKDKFDLVISDVHMPDMDGFKLLELVGLEMDLPVIMLSANGETSAVMKGIKHGAVDYLLKPVRIEELKNIWQHVVRRRKFNNRDQNNLDSVDDNVAAEKGALEAGRDSRDSGLLEGNSKSYKKRKDQNEGDEDDGDENAQDNDDPASQKKPRVVWSVELHHKFVAAVKQLGIEKAVPKRILDLMNVEGLTRENVASHLQKYRLYLKRISSVASQQANLVAAYGSRDASYLSVGSFGSLSNYHTLAGSAQLPVFPSQPPSGVLCRPNFSNDLGFRDIASSRIVKFGGTNDMGSGPINGFGNVQRLSLPLENQSRNMLQGIPACPELIHSPQQKNMQEGRSSLSGGFGGGGLSTSSSGNCTMNSPTSSLFLQSHIQNTSIPNGLVYHSGNMPSLCSDTFEASPNLPDLSGFNDTWPSSATLTRHSSISLPSLPPYPDDDLVTNPMSAVKFNPVTPQTQDAYLDVATSSLLRTAMHERLGSDVNCQPIVVGQNILSTTGIPDNSKFSGFRSQQNSNKHWVGPTQDHHAQQANPSSSKSCMVSLTRVHHSLPGSIEENSRSNGYCDNKPIADSVNQSYFVDSHFQEDYVSGSSKLQGGFSPAGCGLDDLVNAIKMEKDDVSSFMDGNIGCDIFNLGACL